MIVKCPHCRGALVREDSDLLCVNCGRRHLNAFPDPNGSALRRSKPYWTLAEAAREIGFSIDHMGRLCREGKVPGAFIEATSTIRHGRWLIPIPHPRVLQVWRNNRRKEARRGAVR